MLFSRWFRAGTKKYELVPDQQILVGGTTLYRIRALKDFSDVKAGDLGGFIQSERNLSQDGHCWVGGDARVYEEAWVFDNARVLDHATVFDHAQVSGNAVVFDKARIYGKTRVFDNAVVYGEGQVFETAWVYGEALLCGQGLVSGNAVVYGRAKVLGGRVGDDAQLFGYATVRGQFGSVCGIARVGGNRTVEGRIVDGYLEALKSPKPPAGPK